MSDSQRVTGELNLDGEPAPFSLDRGELEAVHLPLLCAWERQWRERRGRYIVLLGGPPGSGKTVLAGIWEQLSRQGLVAVPVQSLPMDGFHYPNRVLDSQRILLDGDSVPLRRIKGRPETFDLPLLGSSLRAIRAGQSVRWPRYDRALHDPVPDAIGVIPEGILVVEGLYLLLDVPGWKDLRAEADCGVFLECPQDVLRADLLRRKQRQGRTYEDAAVHFDLVDHYTWRLTVGRRQEVDALIRVAAGRRLELVAGHGSTPSGTVHPGEL